MQHQAEQLHSISRAVASQNTVISGIHMRWNILLWSLFDVQNCVTDEAKVLAFNGGYRGGAPCCYQDVLGLHRSSFSVSSWQLAAIGDWLRGGVLYIITIAEKAVDVL